MRMGLYFAAALGAVLGLSVAPSPVRAATPVPSIVDEQAEVAKRIDQRVALLTEKLDLNESQQANAEECLKAAVEKFKEIRDDSSLSDDQKKSLWSSSRKAYRNYLRSLLTDEQKETFDALLVSLAADKAKAAKAVLQAAALAAGKPAPDATPDSDPKDPILDDLGAAALPGSS